MEQPNQQPIQEEKESRPPIKTNWKFIVIVVVFALLTIGGILLLKAIQPVPTLPLVPTSTQLIIGEEVKIQGTITENYRGCAADGLCYLQVQTQEGNVQVIYHYGEWPRCINTNLQTGKLEDGDKVEIFGKATEVNTISTCDSPNYYIKNLSEGVNASDFTPSPSTPLGINSVEGWQTYRSDEFGFEVRYPGNFFSERNPSSDVRDELRDNRFGAIVVSFVDKIWEFQEVNNPALHVVVTKTDLSPREWLEKYYKPVSSKQSGNIPEPPVGYRNVQEATINGISILQFDLLFTTGSTKSSVFQKKPDTLYHIMAYSTSLGTFSPELYDQILSTFRFIPTP